MEEKLMPRKKMTQEELEEKAFNSLMNSVQIMYHQALENQLITGRLKAVNGLLTLMIEDLNKREEVIK